jgi:hypothetical protein
MTNMLSWETGTTTMQENTTHKHYHYNTSTIPPPVIQSHPDKIPKEPIEGPVQKQKSERQVTEKQNNHNDCFIEAYYKILGRGTGSKQQY